MCPLFPILWPCSAHPILGGGDPLGLSLLSSLARPPCFRSPPQAPRLGGHACPCPTLQECPGTCGLAQAPPKPSPASLCLLPVSGASLRHHPPCPLPPPRSTHISPAPAPAWMYRVITCLCRHGPAVSQVCHIYRARSRWVPGPFSWAQGCTQRRVQSAPAARVDGGGGGGQPTRGSAGAGLHRCCSWAGGGTGHPEDPLEAELGDQVAGGRGRDAHPAAPHPRESGQAQAGADGPALSGRLGRH